MIEVSVIIPSFKRVQQTIQTTKLVLNSNGIGREFDLEVIIADCTPDDSLKTEIQKTFGTTVVYTRPSRAGISTNKNQGAKVATGKILVFCDSDIEVEPDTLLHTVRALEQSNGAGAIMGQVIWKHGPKEGAHDRPRKEDRLFTKDTTSYIEAIYSRYMATYKSIFDEVGGYDEEVFNMRGEGSDLSMRYWRAGFPLAYNDTIIVHHVFDAPDSIALRVAHPEWGIAKDMLLLAYKYDILDDSNENFIKTVSANFSPLGERGYFNIIQGIGQFIEVVTEAKPIIDRQKKEMKSRYDFKHLEIFSDPILLEECLTAAIKRIAPVRKQLFHD